MLVFIFEKRFQQPQVSRTCLTIFPVPTNAAFCKSSVVLFTSTMVDLLYWITWSVRMLKPYNILTLPYSTSLSGLRLHHLTSLTNQNFWHISKCTILAILSCLCLCYFWASLLHSAIKWVIDSYLSKHILHLSDLLVINVISYPVCPEGLILCCKY